MSEYFTVSINVDDDFSGAKEKRFWKPAYRDSYDEIERIYHKKSTSLTVPIVFLCKDYPKSPQLEYCLLYVTNEKKFYYRSPNYDEYWPYHTLRELICNGKDIVPELLTHVEKHLELELKAYHNTISEQRGLATTKKDTLLLGWEDAVEELPHRNITLQNVNLNPTNQKWTADVCIELSSFVSLKRMATQKTHLTASGTFDGRVHTEKLHTQRMGENVLVRHIFYKNSDMWACDDLYSEICSSIDKFVHEFISVLQKKCY